MTIEAITDGPYAGWQRWKGRHEKRFSDLIGHYYFRDVDGRVECRMDTGMQHANGFGYLHGGFLMAFIDQVLFAVARPRLAFGGAVTMTCNTEFLGSAVPGTPLDGTGEILRETGKMLFIRGLLTQGGSNVCGFSGTLRKVQPKA